MITPAGAFRSSLPSAAVDAILPYTVKHQSPLEMNFSFRSTSSQYRNLTRLRYPHLRAAQFSYCEIQVMIDPCCIYNYATINNTCDLTESQPYYTNPLHNLPNKSTVPSIHHQYSSHDLMPWEQYSSLDTDDLQVFYNQNERTMPDSWKRGDTVA